MKNLKEWILLNLINSRGRINTRKFKKLQSKNNNNCKKIIDLTSFLQLLSKPSERIYCILNDIIAYQKCKMCDNIVSTFIDSTKGYRTYCSVKCMNSDPEMLIKSEKTNIEKYGVKYPCQSKNILDRRKKTNIEKYGCEHPMQNENVKNNFRNSFQLIYGVENPMHLDSVKLKIKKTNIEKYGCEHPMQNKKVKDKFKNSMLDKYGVKHGLQIGLDINSIKHLEDKKWLYNQHHDLRKSYREIANELNVNYGTVYNYIIKHHIPLNNINNFISENEIINFISNDFDIYHQSRSIIPPLELDIYIPNCNLAIEFDGLYWHSNKSKNYHLNKTKLCKEKNIQLFHIFENEWLDPLKKEIWKSIINVKLNRNSRIYARKTEIREIIDNKLVREFLDNNHLQGFIGSSIKLGLFCKEELVSLMTFGKTRFSKKYEYEMIRFCNKKFISVIGGASKLYTYFVNNYKPKSIVSYADYRYSNGNLYKKLGFEFSHFSIPNYWYFKNGSLDLYSRIKFQKHKLSNLLENFNENESEVENMLNNNYRRIFDCGNIIFYKKY